MYKSNRYFRIEDKISYICRNKYKYFLSKSYVQGIGLGYKITKGMCTYEKCIKVFVSNKVSTYYLNLNDIIPKMYDNIKTDVVQTGIFKTMSLTDEIRPVVGGYSLGNELYDTDGCVTCLVTDGHYKYILSNNHVIASINKALIRTKIIQPSVTDGGKVDRNTVAILSKYIPLNFKGTFSSKSNYVDCAIGKILNDSIATDTIAFIGKPKQSIVPRLNKLIKKIGKATELTIGHITETDCTLLVQYSNGKKALFEEQIATNAVALPGDSGAILVDENNYVLGMLVSGLKTKTIYNPMNKVLDSLNVNIVTE